jgi:hypothetical protein
MYFLKNLAATIAFFAVMTALIYLLCHYTALTMCTILFLIILILFLASGAFSD